MRNQIIQGSVLDDSTWSQIPDRHVQCCITSPPYWGLRDYGVEGQLGLESTPEEYVERMVEVFRQVWRVLRDDGTLWLNLGDSYAGSVGNRNGSNSSTLKGGVGGCAADAAVNRKVIHKPIFTGLKPKDLCGIPWRVALALQADGWYLRQDIIWHKPNPMPESVRDRCTKAHEYLFLLTKKPKYYCDMEAVKEPAVCANPEHVNYRKNGKSDKRSNAQVDSMGKPGFGDDMYKQPHVRNKRSVWTVTTKPYKEAHFATFPPKLIEPCVKAGCPEGGIILDPFMGSGTTGMVAKQHGRDHLGIELNPEYIEMIQKRIGAVDPLFTRKERQCTQQ